MKFSMLIVVAILISGNTFANTASVGDNSVLSRTESVPWSTNSNSSGLVAYKQIMNAAQPDAHAVLAGEEATPMFVKAAELLENAQGKVFENSEEAALAILAEGSSL